MSESANPLTDHKVYNVLLSRYDLKRYPDGSPKEHCTKLRIVAFKDSSGQVDLNRAIKDKVRPTFGQVRSIRVAVTDLDRWEHLKGLLGNPPVLTDEDSIQPVSPAIFTPQAGLIVAEMPDGSEIPEKFINRVGNFMVKYAETANIQDLQGHTLTEELEPTI